MSRPDASALARLERELPPSPAPAAHYVPVRQAGDTLYVAGQTPHTTGELELRGRVGAEVSVAQAQSLARTAALNAISALREHLGDLTEVAEIVSVTGYVASTPDFTAHPEIINGASDALVEFFGDDGHHARAAVGVASLPGGAPVEISVIALRRARPGDTQDAAG